MACLILLWTERFEESVDLLVSFIPKNTASAAMFTEPDFTPTPPSTEQDDQELEATSNVIQALDLLDIPLQTAEESFEFPDEEEKVVEGAN